MALPCHGLVSFLEGFSTMACGKESRRKVVYRATYNKLYRHLGAGLPLRHPQTQDRRFV